MPRASSLFFGLCIAILVAGQPEKAIADDAGNAKATTAAAGPGNSNDVARYCANIGPVASEARLAWEMQRLGELEDQLKQRIGEIEAKQAEARDWISRRDAMQKKARDGVVAIFGKMQPEAAASQLIAMDDDTAAAILSKLNPRTASEILNEMGAAQAAKLTDMMLATGDGSKS